MGLHIETQITSNIYSYKLHTECTYSENTLMILHLSSVWLCQIHLVSVWISVFVGELSIIFLLIIIPSVSTFDICVMWMSKLSIARSVCMQDTVHPQKKIIEWMWRFAIKWIPVENLHWNDYFSIKSICGLGTGHYLWPGGTGVKSFFARNFFTAYYARGGKKSRPTRHSAKNFQWVLLKNKTDRSS